MRELLDRASGTLVDGDRARTAPELAERAERVAGALAASGVREGDRAALVLPGGVDWFVAHLALARLGVLTVPVSTRLAVREIADLVRSSGSPAPRRGPGFPRARAR